ASSSLRSFATWAATTRRLCSSSRTFPAVARVALPRGSRKLRAKPGFTVTRSPASPRPETDSRRISFTPSMPRTSQPLSGVGEERELARPLDRDRERPLVAGAVSGDPARDHLARLRHEEAQRLLVLVVDRKRRVRAEAADLPPDEAALALLAA